MRAVLAVVGARLAVPVEDAWLLHLHSNALFALPSAGLVVRIATNPDALERVATSIAVTRWLTSRGFPCVVPADLDEQPLVVDGRVVSVWRHVPATPDPKPTGRELGGLLRGLHSQPTPPVRLRQFDDPFYSVAAAISQAIDTVTVSSHGWLSDRIDRLRGQWAELDFARPPGLIHGDAHTGNLMRVTSGQVVLGDWDHVAAGPREWDLVQIHYLSRRFGHAGGEDLDAFAAAYGWDVREWPGLDTLISIREITGLSPYIRAARDKPFARQELAHRLRTLRDGETGARWHSPPPGPGSG